MIYRKVAFAALAGSALILALLIFGPKSPPGFPEMMLPTAPNFPTISDATKTPPIVTLAPVTLKEATIKAGMTLYDALRAVGIAKGETHALINSLKQQIDPRRLPVGTPVDAYFASMEDDRPSSIEMKLDDLRLLRAAFTPAAGWTTEIHEATVETQVASYAGIVSSSLWNSASAVGMDPALIYQLAEIFAWQVDFNREVQQKDKWRLTVERRMVDGKTIGYGNIIAAEYVNVGTVYSAVLFDSDGSNGRYYTGAGQSLRRMFLKSALKYGRITSGFQASRFHPILHVTRAHKGIDYGAPTGTPVMSVGDGTVTVAARRGGSGKMIAVRHNAVYETEYKHLSAFAAGLAPGTRVSMGQVIGYVGSTGLATGPHLHFEFHVNGQYVDPQGLKFPTADPVPEALMAAFKAKSEAVIAALPTWNAEAISSTEAPLVRTAAKSAE